jgi:hypothetical protein
MNILSLCILAFAKGGVTTTTDKWLAPRYQAPGVIESTQ